MSADLARRGAAGVAAHRVHQRGVEDLRHQGPGGPAPHRGRDPRGGQPGRRERGHRAGRGGAGAAGLPSRRSARRRDPHAARRHRVGGRRRLARRSCASSSPATGTGSSWSVRGSLDNIVGTVRAADLLPIVAAGRPARLREVMREPLFVPDSTEVFQLLEAFRDSHRHLAVVLDEFGAVEGLVTITDLLEAIVGEIPTEPAHRAMVSRPDGSWLVDAAIAVDEVFTSLGLELPEGEEGAYHTLGGFVLARLGRIPHRVRCLRMARHALRGARHGRPPHRQGADHATRRARPRVDRRRHLVVRAAIAGRRRHGRRWQPSGTGANGGGTVSRCRSSRWTESITPTATCRCSTGPPSRWSPGNASPCSAATAPASRRCCRSSTARSRPMPARSGGSLASACRGSSRTCRWSRRGRSSTSSPRASATSAP